ncbi:MAG TPA: rhomboid family intramembrane serine protease [Tepidisphaeraceae bacterium]|nr:rhomboid family intramembrane serine protease [Tepidisphaeraceae bacterium]
MQCQCGRDVSVQETQADRDVTCSKCGKAVACISGEPIDADAAAGDFDAGLLVVAGPSRVGQLIRLGGCAPLIIGKQAGCQLVLPGNLVSRAHCQLVRVDFGPSRWKIEDRKSTNGLFVNRQRISSHELQDGDILHVGEYELRYQVAELSPALPAGIEADAHDPLDVSAPVRSHTSIVSAHESRVGPSVHSSGPTCPSCDRLLGNGARVCIECGIRVPSGRPLLTSNGLDENTVHGNTETILKFVSWLIWVTPLPMPLASSAYGRHKPYAIWAIAAITVIASLVFLAAIWNNKDGAAQNAMLWPRQIDFEKLADEAISRSPRLLKLTVPAEPGEEPAYTRQELREKLAEDLRKEIPPFHWWQLLTSAFLHDPDSVIGFVLHLGGNMLFLIVFGSRVNAIIGNTATAIVYPLLAIASGSMFLLTLPGDQATPLLGASGAINGLAGMYLVLFPAHLVYCAMWFRLRLHLMFKIFALRGFWVLLIYFAFDVIMVAIGKQGHTAHWAHIGGFLTGVGLGVLLLVSRQFDCRNGDLLSLILGKHAWPLIGKPKRIARGAMVG